MARFKNHLLVVLGFTFAGMIGVAFGTGTAQAVVATLVEVVNPSTSPVPTSTVNVTDPGRIAYETTASSLCTVGISFCSIEFPSVPAGHRLVIQHVSGSAQFNADPGDVTAVLAGNQDPFDINFLVPTATTDLRSFDQSVLAYVNSGNNWILQVKASNASASVTSLSLSASGYELDCTAATCAPIATQ